MSFWPDSLGVFDSLPLAERLFVRGRAFSAPLEALAHRARGPEVVDVGCGHGVLVSMLAARPHVHVTGIDPDPRKIEWARKSVGLLPNVSLEVAEISALKPESFDTVCIADVVYLLTLEAWPAFFHAAFICLKPGGLLLLKEAEDDGSWRASKALWQERLMVRLLGRTRSSGAIQVPSRSAMIQALETAGFELGEAVALGAGFTTPHLLLTAQKSDMVSSVSGGQRTL